jgi:galactose mutarotase-like enzyme
MSERHDFANGVLSASVLRHGAELCRLDTGAGDALLWHGGPEWPRHSPVLFPIVGELAGQHLRHNGQVLPMARHGFARTSDFVWQERTETGCTLVLADNAATRAQYPFPFRLTLRYTLAGAALTVETIVTNPGPSVLPASVGAHPAFRWPLSADLAKTDYTLVFAKPEPAPVRRIDAAGLVLAEPQVTPVTGDTLKLDPALFAADAIIMEAPASRSVRYGTPGGMSLVIAWEGFRQLGIWSKPGADFLCIEPWFGTASPVGFDAEFTSKPGLMHLAPGEERVFRYSVGVER